MKRALAAAGLAVAAGGCGSRAPAPKPTPPLLPRAPAQAWIQQTSAIAASLAANDGCTAQARVTVLEQEIGAAVSAHRIPQRLLGPLSRGVDDLAAQISCVPPLVSTGHANGNGHDNGNGNGNEGGD